MFRDVCLAFRMLIIVLIIIIIMELVALSVYDQNYNTEEKQSKPPAARLIEMSSTDCRVLAFYIWTLYTKYHYRIKNIYISICVLDID